MHSRVFNQSFRLTRQFIVLAFLILNLGWSSVAQAKVDSSTISHTIQSSRPNNNELQSESWNSGGPYGGAGSLNNSLAVSATDPNVIFFAASGGGLYRTLNAGDSWTKINSTLEFDRIQVVSIAPSNSQIIYVGTDLWGVYKSVDGGNNWTWISNGLNCNTVSPFYCPSISNLAIDPADPNTVYVSEYGLLYKTNDGGNRWLELGEFPNYILQIEIDPVNHHTIYFGTGITGGSGMYKSSDDGVTWHAINQGLGNAEIYSIAISPTDPQTILVNASYFGSTNLTPTGIYKSSDGGNSWVPTSLVGNYWDYRSMFVTFDNSTNPAIAYAQAPRTNVQKSIDGGESWNIVHSISLGYTISGFVAFGQILYETRGTQGQFQASYKDGFYSSRDGGLTWARKSDGIQNLTINNLALNPANENEIYATVYGEGLWKTTNSGQSWSRVESYYWPVSGALAFAPSNPSTIFAGNFKSVDDGLTWEPTNLSSLSGGVSSYAIDPFSEQVVFAGGDAGIYKSQDGGNSWTLVENISPPRFIVIDPNNRDTIYAGGGDGDGLLKSIDGGNTWISYTTGFNWAELHSFAISPNNPQFLYASTPLGMSTSTDGGQSWSQEVPLDGVGSADSEFAVALSVENDNLGTVYAGSNLGNVYKTTDMGTTWTTLNRQGLPPIQINSMVLSNTTGKLFLGTIDDSIWQNAVINSGLTPSISLDVTGPTTLTVVNNQYSPNPFDVTATVLNDGTATATNVQLALTLPIGLTLASGTATQSIGDLAVGQEGQITWSITAASQRNETTVLYSVAAVASNAESRTVSRNIVLPAITPLPTNKEFSIVSSNSNEPSLAVDPMDPKHLVVGFNDNSSSKVLNCSWSESFDGGDSWSAPKAIRLPAGYDQTGDPWVRFGHDGKLYYSCMGSGMPHRNGFLRTWKNGVFISVSLSGHATDFSVANVINTVDQSCVGYLCQKGQKDIGEDLDHPAFAELTKNDGSAVLVACWVDNISGTTTSSFVNVAISANFGVTWSTSKPIGGPNGAYCMLGGGNGLVAASWLDFDGVDYNLKLKTSADGETWSTPVILASASDFVAVDKNGTPSTTDKVLSAPYALIVSKGNNVLRAFYQIRKDGRSQVFVADSDNNWVGTAIDNSGAETFLPGSGVCPNVVGMYQGLPGANAGFRYTIWVVDTNRVTTRIFRSGGQNIDLYGKFGFKDSRYTLRRIGDYTGVDCGGNGAVAAWTDTRANNSNLLQIWGANVPLP